MHIEYHPTGLFHTISIQVLDDLPDAGAHDLAIGSRYDPGVALHAACVLTWRSEIDGRPGRTGIPPRVRAAGKRPNLTVFKRQLKLGLFQVWWQQRLDSPVKGIT